ncbi:enoyl-CoA hydratase/isomerase family protein [Micromonospora zamorensis]|uniref:enoyl-CoA hydratase/isomerase family protein n=1 Tax=Micromonospora zamorensis TaxID=709883 RepID=UPI003411F4ED
MHGGPQLSGDYTVDKRRMAAYLTGLAEDDPAAGRAARRRFLDRHAEPFYAELTGGLREYHRLNELAERAARALPGLVPEADALKRERSLPQAAKSGLEIDLGILFGSVLRAPVAGRHLTAAMRQPTARATDLLPEFSATGEADLGVVTVRRRCAAAEVTVRNNRFLNAEDDLLVEALEIAVDLVMLDDTVRVGIMRGGPMDHRRYDGVRVFSAGINLTRLHQGEISLLDFFVSRELGYINKIYRGLAPDGAAADWLRAPVEKPWIGVVDSFAIGGGAQIQLVFDHVIAEAGAYFTLPALREGIIPGLTNLRLAGGRLARRAVFADERIDAAGPYGHLLADTVVEPAGIDAAVSAAVSRLAEPAVLNNRRIMHGHEEPEEVFRAYLADYAFEQPSRLYSPDLVANLEQTWVSRSRA